MKTYFVLNIHGKSDNSIIIALFLTLSHGVSDHTSLWWTMTQFLILSRNHFFVNTPPSIGHFYPYFYAYFSNRLHIGVVLNLILEDFTSKNSQNSQRLSDHNCIVSSFVSGLSVNTSLFVIISRPN